MTISTLNIGSVMLSVWRKEKKQENKIYHIPPCLATIRSSLCFSCRSTPGSTTKILPFRLWVSILSMDRSGWRLMVASEGLVLFELRADFLLLLLVALGRARFGCERDWRSEIRLFPNSLPPPLKNNKHGQHRIFYFGSFFLNFSSNLTQW